MLNQEELDELRRRVRTSSKSLRQRYSRMQLFQSLLRKVRDNSVATEQDYVELRQALLQKDPGLLQRLCELLPNPSETELRVFLLLRFGMTKREASSLIPCSKAAVTNCCTRLFQKVHGRKCSTSAEADEWLLGL